MKKILLLVATTAFSLSISTVSYAEDIEKAQSSQPNVVEKEISVEGLDDGIKPNEIIPLRDGDAVNICPPNCCYPPYC